MEEIEVVKKEVGGIMSWANGLVVNSQNDYKLAIDGIRRIREIKNRWVSFWEPLRKKTYEAYKETLQKEQEGVKVCEIAEKTAKQKADAWRVIEERKAEEERRRLQAIADERARKERERLEKEAEKLKTPELKEERLEQAQSIQAPIIQARNIVIEGTQVKELWKAELIDFDALVKAATPGSIAYTFIKFDEKTANQFARNTKGKVAVPGIRFVKERITVISKGGENGQK